MIHEKFIEMIQLALLEELNDEELKVLHDHLMECGNCQKEYERLSDLYTLLNKNKFPEADEQLLEEARRQFRNSFNYELSKQSIIEKSINSLRKFIWFHKTPVLAGAFSLCAGILVGFLFWGQGLSYKGSIEKDSGSSNMMITNVQFSEKNSQTGEIEFTFDAIKQIKMKGRLSDPTIQKILAEALINEKNPGARIETVNALAANVNGKAKPNPRVKSALITALKSDLNPRVRMEALSALLNYPYDSEINEGLLYVLQHDNNSGLRIAAINGLAEESSKGSLTDPQTLNVLNQKIKNDDNEYVRIRAASLIKEGQIQ